MQRAVGLGGRRLQAQEGRAVAFLCYQNRLFTASRCSPLARARLGDEVARCFLKMEGYVCK